MDERYGRGDVEGQSSGALYVDNFVCALVGVSLAKLGLSETRMDFSCLTSCLDKAIWDPRSDSKEAV